MFLFFDRLPESVQCVTFFFHSWSLTVEEISPKLGSPFYLFANSDDIFILDVSLLLFVGIEGIACFFIILSMFIILDFVATINECTGEF